MYPIDVTVTEFDLAGIIRKDFPITLDIWYDNIDEGLPDGIIDIYVYSGDGVVTVDDFDAGTLFTSFTAINNSTHIIDFGGPYEYSCGYASIDVTSIVLAMLDYDDTYLGIRLSTETSDRYNIGDMCALPNPVLTIIPEPATICLFVFGGIFLRKIKE
jgi:hypothetical protein